MLTVEAAQLAPMAPIEALVRKPWDHLRTPRDSLKSFHIPLVWGIVADLENTHADSFS